MVDKRKQQTPAPTDSTALIGMKEICAFLRRSEPTVLKLVEQYPASIPIKKVSGVYESDRLELDRWRREVLLAPMSAKVPPGQEPGGAGHSGDDAKGPGEGGGSGEEKLERHDEESDAEGKAEL